ncbi:MAG: radical SAM protein [Alphaproteobacteria bacterium]|nr:radical SAM protein [Alphaproteobacteria bacterium]
MSATTSLAAADRRTRRASHWTPAFRKLLDRAGLPEVSLEARVGAGLQLLMRHPDDPLVLHASLHPAGVGLDGPVVTDTTVMRYTATTHPRPWRSKALKAVAIGARLVERDTGWRGFLLHAQERPMVSLPSLEGEAGRRTSGASVLIRLLEPCNAGCAFCSCVGIMPDRTESLADVVRRLDEARADGVASVVFTGGEPLLSPDLVPAVREAAARGFEDVGIQTNATKLDDPAKAQALAEAGLRSAFVSLHGHTAALHDRVLVLEGAFARATVGIDNLLANGVLVRLNHVICRDNAPHVADFARFVIDRWGSRVAVTWSFVSPIGAALEHLEVIPRILDVRDPLAEALDACVAAGVDVDVPGLCGLPRCILPAHEHLFAEAQDEVAPPDLPTRRKVAACRTCTRKTSCSGYWSVYLEQYGEDELGPPEGWEI